MYQSDFFLHQIKDIYFIKISNYENTWHYMTFTQIVNTIILFNIV